MARHRLNNYLRAYRRRLGLSQDDVAFLCGARNGAQVSRYECGKRRPTLENLLACEAIFQIPVRELFAGRFEDVLKTVSKRAELRAHELTVLRPGLATTRRLRTLASLGKAAPKD
jgi:transcriptional regulator with XRE-family HTH domain